MAKHKIDKTDTSHLMVHPEGRGKVVAIKVLLGLLVLLILALLFFQFVPNGAWQSQRPEPRRAVSSPSRQPKTEKEVDKVEDKPKITETENEDAEFKWEDKDFQALEIGKTTSEEVLASFGKAHVVRESEDSLILLYQDQPAISRYNPQEIVNLVFAKEGEDLILTSKSSKNLVRPYENNKADEGEPVWTKADYGQLVVTSPSSSPKGLTYDQVFAKYGIPYGLDFLEQHSAHESKKTMEVWYFHPTKPGDDTPNPYVSVDLVFEQDKDGVYYLVEKTSFDYD